MKLVTENPNWEANIAALNEIKSPCLKECALAFQANMIRSSSFGVLPVELLYQSVRNSRMTANVFYRVLGIGAMTLAEQMAMDVTPEMKLQFAKEAGENDRISPEIQKRLRYEVGLGQTEQFLSVNAQMQSSIDALFTSIVLESWLFFEALAGDLWCIGVDNGGNTISARIIQHAKWGKSEIGVSDTAHVQSNAKTQPGSYRREVGIVSFQKLHLIKEYYSVAFGSDSMKIFDDISGGYINALSAVRNCITHRAGKADHHFMKSAVGRFQEWNAIKLDDRVLLDGEITKKLNNASLETGIALLNFVDACLLRGD